MSKLVTLNHLTGFY